MRRGGVLKRAWLLAAMFCVFEGRAETERHKEVFGMMNSRYGEIRDYQCRIAEWCTDGSGYEKRTMNFYFKKPNLMRMDILKGNRLFDKGTVAVYLGGEKVTGHRGGLLRDIVLNVPKTSSLATTIRGVTIDESGMESVLMKIPFFIRNGNVSMKESDTEYEFECVPFDASKNDGVTMDVLRVDKKSLLAVYYERFVGASSVQRVKWSDYIINAGLPDDLFDVGFDMMGFEERGVPLIRQTVD